MTDGQTRLCGADGMQGATKVSVTPAVVEYTARGVFVWADRNRYDLCERIARVRSAVWHVPEPPLVMRNTMLWTRETLR